jgi:hypothetical protein
LAVEALPSQYRPGQWRGFDLDDGSYHELGASFIPNLDGAILIIDALPSTIRPALRRSGKSFIQLPVYALFYDELVDSLAPNLDQTTLVIGPLLSSGFGLSLRDRGGELSDD